MDSNLICPPKNFIGSSLAYDFIANRITNRYLSVYRFISRSNLLDSVLNEYGVKSNSISKYYKTG